MDRDGVRLHCLRVFHGGWRGCVLEESLGGAAEMYAQSLVQGGTGPYEAWRRDPW